MCGYKTWTKWKHLGTSRDLRLTHEQRHNMQAVDVSISQRSGIFIGNGIAAPAGWKDGRMTFGANYGNGMRANIYCRAKVNAVDFEALNRERGDSITREERKRMGQNSIHLLVMKISTKIESSTVGARDATATNCT
ncbi:hypothetical protein BGW80DRAFT_1256280 [Lactifluus volemus]|nr:hypothetical protein BGW80DRAFT_1256280 [Lactifluus volemus]